MPAIGCAIRLGFAAVECFTRVGKAVPARVPTSGKVFAGVWSDSPCTKTRNKQKPRKRHHDGSGGTIQITTPLRGLPCKGNKNNSNYKQKMETTKEMSIAQALREQKAAISHEYRSIYQIGIACIRAQRTPLLVKYYDKAGVPASNCSNTAAKEWLQATIFPMLPQLNEGGKRVFVSLQKNKLKAMQFVEGADVPRVEDFANIKGVQLEYGSPVSEDDKRRSVYFFVNIKQKNGGLVHKYITDTHDESTITRVRDAFFAFLGLDKAGLAQIKEDEKAANAKLKQRAKTNTQTKASKQVNKF